MAKEKIEKEFTFSWTIENFTLCVHKRGEHLSSPEFTADNLSGSKWQLRLYPRGHNKKCNEYVSCFLSNVNLNSNNIRIDFKIELIDAKKKIVTYHRDEDHLFAVGRAWGWPCFLKRNQLLKIINNISDDALTLSCRMVEKCPNSTLLTGIEALTKLVVYRCSFQWIVENPESSDWSKSKKLDFPNISQIEVTLTAPDDVIRINVRRIHKTSTLQCFKSKIALMDVEEKEVNYKILSCLFISDDQEWKFLSVIKKSYLNENKDTALRDGFFKLQCEFSVSNGETSEEIQNYLYFTPKVDASPNVEDETLSHLQNDLLGMLTCKKHADVKLHVHNETFPAHKSVLSARSSVFSAMFDADVAESQTGEVDIQGMDAETFNSFLKFLYAGKIEKLDFQNASKLIVVADEYKVSSLKEKCSAFLMSAMSDDKVCEILNIADLIRHNKLKQSAIDYIKINSDKILQSSEWQQLIGNNVKLGSEVLCKLSSNFSTFKSNMS